MKTLIMYYSHEGNTQVIAEAIAGELKADIERIIPKSEKPEETGFNKYFWGGKQVFMRQKPDLKTFVKNPNDYDLIFIGTPIWSWTFSPAIRTLFDNRMISGKKIYFFCTHEGGLRGAIEKSRALIERANEWIGFQDFANVKKDIAGSQSKAIEWIKSLNLK